jgi:hypothetical protein
MLRGVRSSAAEQGQHHAHTKFASPAMAGKFDMGTHQFCIASDGGQN